MNGYQDHARPTRRPVRRAAQRRLTRSRARRIQRRLARIQQERVTREQRVLRGQPASGLGRRRLRVAAAFAGALLLGVALAPVVTSVHLPGSGNGPPTLTSIAVMGNERLSSREVALATGLPQGSELAAIAPAELEERLARHPWIRTARFALLPTGTLIVSVDERSPRAVIRDADGHARFVDAEGVAFAAAQGRIPRDALAIPALARLEAGGTGDPGGTLRDSLALARQLGQLALPGLADPRARHRGLTLVLPRPDSEEGWVLRGGANGPARADGVSVILGVGGPDALGDRLARLERLLASPHEEVHSATTIDLRFAGQAVLRAAGATSM